jgi:hypothetical protein
MKIKEVTRYVYKDKEYKTLKEIKEAVENTIGEEVLDKINKTIEIRHKDLIPLLDLLCSPEVRKVLLESLNITFERYKDFEEEETETINILDL